MTADTSGAGNSQSLLKLATQDVAKPITGAAIFQVLAVAPGAEARAAVRALCGDLPGLLRAVGFRDIEADLSWRARPGRGLVGPAWLACPAWPGCVPSRRSSSRAGDAVATPGDLLLHIRAARMDLCFELATQVVKRLGGAITAVDEVHGLPRRRRCERSPRLSPWRSAHSASAATAWFPAALTLTCGANGCSAVADEKGVDAGTERARLAAGVWRYGDISSAEDVANLALFLASDESRTITGQSIPVDAGGYMQG